MRQTIESYRFECYYEFWMISSANEWKPSNHLHCLWERMTKQIYWTTRSAQNGITSTARVYRSVQNCRTEGKDSAEIHSIGSLDDSNTFWYRQSFKGFLAPLNNMLMSFRSMFDSFYGSLFHSRTEFCYIHSEEWVGFRCGDSYRTTQTKIYWFRSSIMA